MGYKIVIVDDEAELLENLHFELSRLKPDWDIIICNMAYEAKMRVMKGDIDLLITDVAMPDMNGFELFSAVVDYNPDLPVIMMTGFGYDPDHNIVNSKQLGLQDVMFKPVDTDKLIAKIEKRLELN
ncbi:MAG: response regulator [Candidatus Zophobacter franzmannii]|jgi:DNA-binding NtrC family response regulator|nr:response regulator [Candidatus Zophobacter franzmannii]